MKLSSPMTRYERGHIPKCCCMLSMSCSMCSEGLGQRTLMGCMVAYEILSLASLHCKEWQGSPWTPTTLVGMHLLWWMWMMRRGLSSSPGPPMMVCFCLGISCSSKASMTGHRSLWVPMPCISTFFLFCLLCIAHAQGTTLVLLLWK